jgi:hypothetical protein
MTQGPARSERSLMIAALEKLRRSPWLILWAVLLAISAAFFVYSQTTAFVWDEGFHLVAAQLIAWGKTPYIDFAFPQTLLNAYFNAGVLRFASGSWRAVHAFDALFVAATICFASMYMMRRFPEPSWRLTCAILTASFVGFNTVVIAFGPVAQAYGSGTLLIFSAFYVGLASVDRRSAWFAFWTGLLASAAAGSTLLTVPAVPVLFLWILLENRAGSRSRKLLAFCGGILLAFLPEIALFIRAPRQTWFNVVEYQAIFRRVNWGDVGAHDFDVFTDWTASAQALLLGLFALIGLFFIARRSGWERRLRREFYLAAALAAALGIYIATAHPTFGRYFIFMIPFLAIVASAGFYYTASRLFSPEHPLLPAAVVIFIFAAGAAKYIFDDRDATHWSNYQAIAKKIQEITPRGREYFADEMVYFLLRQTPPSGMEFSYSHKIELSPEQEALYHVISLKNLKRQVARGRFSTFETCKDEIVDSFELDKHYPNSQEFDDCTVYWRK